MPSLSVSIGNLVAPARRSVIPALAVGAHGLVIPRASGQSSPGHSCSVNGTCPSTSATAAAA